MDCSGDELRSRAIQRRSARAIAASGQASGKRMHKPVTIVKEWGAATPQLMAMKPSYDVKKVEGTGARAPPTAMDGPDHPGRSRGTVRGGDGAATKTRSNIQNN